MYILLIVIVLAVLFGVIALASMYNGLVRLKKLAENAWSQIDVQLKRRHDLIPNLVNAVKGYMGFEQKVLTDVTNARAAASQPTFSTKFTNPIFLQSKWAPELVFICRKRLLSAVWMVLLKPITLKAVPSLLFQRHLKGIFHDDQYTGPKLP